MTFEAPGISDNEEGHLPPVVTEIDPKDLTGRDLEAAFNARAIEEESLTPSQRLELHNKGYRVTLPEGEVTINPKLH